jgi:hypothetical protein
MGNFSDFLIGHKGGGLCLFGLTQYLLSVVSASPEVRLHMNSCFPDSHGASVAVPLRYSAVRKAAGLPTEQHKNHHFKFNDESASATSKLANRKRHTPIK